MSKEIIAKRKAVKYTQMAFEAKMVPGLKGWIARLVASKRCMIDLLQMLYNDEMDDDSFNVMKNEIKRLANDRGKESK